MNASRPWLALTVACFCFPLFLGLTHHDLENDEAIYSFAVDRILEAGNWLEPKGSPVDNMPFLEKPPLKFWIVAAPIKLGLLPHNEFGLRFWDALFGGAAFVYVFLLGTRLFNPVAGAVAVLVLFTHRPLLFDHGLRDNAMEGPLFLCYCGGMYHFLRWADPAAPDGTEISGGAVSHAEGAGFRKRGLHALAVGLYFVLGFMTKFVAALFLPLILGVTVFALRPYRTAFRRDWRWWALSCAVVLVLTVPWFVYANARYGAFYWQAMIGEHVYRRFTSFLDPGHVQPWYFYVTAMYHQFLASGTLLLAVLGLGALAAQAVRRRWAEAAVVLIWFALPLLLISAGTSKLYHYTYPFLPPVALAIGYLVALLFALAPAPFDRALASISAWANGTARTRSLVSRPIVKATFAALAVVAAALGVASLFVGTVRIPFGDDVVFRSSGIFRPAMAAFALVLPLGLSRRAGRILLPCLIAAALPLPGYRTALEAMTDEVHPYRSVSECVQRIDAGRPGGPRGLYVVWPDAGIWHPVNYYFRRVRPVERAQTVDVTTIERYGGRTSGNGFDLAGPRPLVIAAPLYRALPTDVRAALPAPLDLRYDALLFLPGPYAVCRADAGILDAPR
jgi:4-amino-4-deoxy-L-arabinose transferase-like glycosyltransferase